MENWLGTSMNRIQGWTTVRESYSCDLEQGPLARRRRTNQVMVTELTAERPDRENFRLHREFLPRISTFAKAKLGSDKCNHFPKAKSRLKDKTTRLLTSVRLAWVSGPRLPKDPL